MKGKKKAVGFGAMAILLLAFYFLLPARLFQSPYSTVVYGADDELLGARIATDGQWRFPPNTELPKNYTQAVILFEDKHFYSHPGIDPLAIGRALWVNLKSGKKRQGGSTITMQVVRMALENQPRTYWQKTKELLLALRIELTYSKEEILALYAAHAPFGGNVVGLEAAAWRYFSRPSNQLSIAEYALLAVLPNAPSAMHPGKNTAGLLAKRNALLAKLLKKGVLDSTEYSLSILEELPTKPRALPNLTPHITQWANSNKVGQAFKTSIQPNIQQHTNMLVDRSYKTLRNNGVHNAAVIIADVETGQVIAYVGNTNAGKDHGEYVDICQAPRSSGSILKPFLFSAMQGSGQLLPNQLVADIPTFLAGFQPENYSREYEGAVPAGEALARSLNVPAVRELKEFGVSRFKQELQYLGFETVNRSAENYGLSLILGGAEVTLWDICAAYVGMAQSVLKENRNVSGNAMHFAVDDTLGKSPKQNPAAAFLTLKSLLTSNHGYGQSNSDQSFDANIAWKTGTSFGFRDAWAVGVNAKYVVGVWVGNADGEGRPGVVGAEAAAPLMFEIFSGLPNAVKWFLPPYNAMVKVKTCLQSGFLASPSCPEFKTLWATSGSENASICQMHKALMLSKDLKYTLTADCEGQEGSSVKSWFVLPPAWEYYYKKKNPGYETPPPIKPGCGTGNSNNPMQLIYPSVFQKVVMAKQVSGETGPVIFKLAHRNYRSKVFWHANDVFLGETTEKHELAVQLPTGSYLLRVVDEDGNELTQKFEVL